MQRSTLRRGSKISQPASGDLTRETLVLVVLATTGLGSDGRVSYQLLPGSFPNDQ